jgi:ADP-glucose pyrophosphorylase
VEDYQMTSREFDPASTANVSRNLSLGAGARVTDSIVWDDVEIGAGAAVTGCIVTDGARIDPGAKYSNSILMRGADGRTVVTPLPVEHR